MKKFEYLKYAENIVQGLTLKDLNPKSCGIVEGELQKIYRDKNKDRFKGSIPIYICKQIYEYRFKSASIYYVTAKMGIDLSPKFDEKEKITAKDTIFRDHRKDEGHYSLEEAICGTLYILTKINDLKKESNLDHVLTKGMFEILLSSMRHYKNIFVDTSDS